MRIRKISDTTPVTGTVTNVYNINSTDGYSCDYVNDKLYNIISVGLNTNQGNDSGTFIVKFDKTLFSLGDIFTLQSDGGIRCNQNCTIEINSCLRFGYSNSTTKNMNLYKNTTQIIELSQQLATANTQTISSYIMDVETNDVIYIKGRTDIGSAFIAIRNIFNNKKNKIIS